MSSNYPFTEFEQACEEQGIAITSEFIRDAGQSGKSSLQHTVEPNSLFSAVVEAGIELYRSPSKLISDGVLDEAKMPQTLAGQTLARMLNASYLQTNTTGYDSTTPFAHAAPLPETVHTCNESEPLFSRMINKLSDEEAVLQRSFATERNERTGLIIVHDNEPVALRKSEGKRSFLTLKPLVMQVGELAVPVTAGSLMFSDLPEPQDQAHFKISQLSETPMTFMRLSAFAADPIQRTNFADFMNQGSKKVDETFPINNPEGYIMHAASLQNIHAIATQAMHWLQEG